MARDRSRLYWEPIYDPDPNIVFKKSDWNFDHLNGPKRCTFKPEANHTGTKIVEEIDFSEASFEGEFKYRIVFKKCVFKKCDFALSTFHRAKFTDCEFLETTFSLCNLYDCELRDCTFKEIGFSGNETLLEKTLITNPSDFINAGTTNLRNLPKGKSAFIQSRRLEITKSTLARSLMATLANEGSEKTYYDGVKISTIQEGKANLAESLLKIETAWKNSGKNPKGKLKRLWIVAKYTTKYLGTAADLAILKLIGRVNAWGSSIARPLFLGIGLILAFGLLHCLNSELDFGQGVMKASELLFLFGYTKYSTIHVTGLDNAVLLSNALVGILWYVVAIPTLVNKLTRVRS